MRGKLGVHIPILEQENIYDFFQLSLGTYRFKRALLYIALARRYELEQKRDTFDNEHDFKLACRGRPEELKIFYRTYRGPPPNDWDCSRFGKFPGELLFLFTTFPSAHFTLKGKSRVNDKHTLLGGTHREYIN